MVSDRTSWHTGKSAAKAKAKPEPKQWSSRVRAGGSTVGRFNVASGERSGLEQCMTCQSEGKVVYKDLLQVWDLDRNSFSITREQLCPYILHNKGVQRIHLDPP